MFKYQPIKGLYGLWTVSTAVVHLPLLAVYYALPRNRPRREWTLKASLFVAFLKKLFYYYCVVEARWPLNLKPGPDKENFEVVPPAPASLLKGPLVDKDVKPTEIGGLWIPRRYETNQDTSNILLYFHGGGFVNLDCRGPFDRLGLKLLCKELPAAAAFSVEYRLASNASSCQFPAQLQDALSEYRFLVEDKGIHHSRIILVGDSAGSHICINLVRYLTQYPGALPLPQAAFLSSPWVNLTAQGCTVNGNPRQATDHVLGEQLEWGARCFIPRDVPRDSEWISPIYHPFSTKVPIWVEAGTAEIFYEDISKWTNAMRSIRNNKIELHELPAGNHSVFLLFEMMDMKETQVKAIRAAQAFLGEHAEQAIGANL